MPRTYRAVIGHTGRGNYGHGLDVVWKGLADVELVAVADPDDTGRAAAQSRTGAPRTYADYHDMLATERPDFVSVAARWLDQHEEMVLAAVAAGVRGIFCEKPFARTLAQADRMLAAAERAGTQIAIAHQYRTMALPREMRRIVASGELGEIREVRARPTIGPRGGSFLSWVLGTHVLDLMRFLLGADPEWVVGRVTTRAGHEATIADARDAAEAYGPLAGDAVSAMYGFPNGITGFCDSYYAPTVFDDSFTIEVLGSQGIIAMGSPGSLRLLRWSPNSGRSMQDLEEVVIPGYDPQQASDLNLRNQEIVRDLIAAVEEKRPPLSSGADGRWALEMILGPHWSQRTGARVPLPSPERAGPYDP